MIWFVCRQCGKRHGRPESQAGTLVFCECGQGNRVPWESTTSEPDPSEVPTPSMAAPAELPPVSEEARLPRPAPRRAWEGRKPNPAYCFHHDETASAQTCEDCRCAFCADCVVQLGGHTLCGPCKNFRVRALRRPLRVAPLAIVAMVVAFVSTPVAFVLTLAAIGQQVMGGATPGLVVLCLIGLLLPAGSMLLAWIALRRSEARPGVGGTALAAAGAVAGLAGALWALSAGFIVVAKQ